VSGSVGVERIFPVNLPALQKVEINKKVQFVELEFSTSENLLVKKQNQRQKKIVKYLFIIKVPTVWDFFCLLNFPLTGKKPCKNNNFSLTSKPIIAIFLSITRINFI
jgi:hypothetical protein